MTRRRFYHCLAIPYESAQILLLAPMLPALIVLVIGGIYPLNAFDAFFFALMSGGAVSLTAIIKTSKLPEFDAEFFEGGDDNGYN